MEPASLVAWIHRTLVSAAILPLVVLGLGTASCAEPDVPRATMPLMKAVPTIDGVIGEEEWQHAVRSVGFVSHNTGTLAVRRGVFWIGSDGKRLLVALKTELPPDGRILTRAVPDGSRDVLGAFLDDASAGYLKRQGPDVDDDGRVRRHEAVQYLVFLPERRAATLTAGSAWQNGQWYLLVANWSWPTLELSVNGEPFQVKPLPAMPPEGNFGSLVVGDRSGNVRGLVDEVLAFRRPLTADEVRLLYTLCK